MPRKIGEGKFKLTKTDLEVLEIIKAHATITGRVPSLRQIAKLRGLKAHGSSQRAVNALLAAKLVRRDPNGYMEVPGLQLPSEPHTARLVNVPGQPIIAAPAPGLVAWRATRDEPDFEITAGDIVFAVENQRVELSQAALTCDSKGRWDLFVRRFHGSIRFNKQGHQHVFRTDEETGEKIEVSLIGPVRFVLSEWRT